jgi:hypothetical protein
MVFLDLLSVLFLSIVFIQDFKERLISWFLPLLIFISLSAKAYYTLNITEVLTHVIINSTFISFQILLLTAWISLKNKKLINIIDTYLGLGDLLFFIAITAAFSPFQYILFYTFSISLTLLGFIIYKALYKNTRPEIPLAGSMAVCMIIFIVLTMIIPDFSSYSDKYSYLFH